YKHVELDFDHLLHLAKLSDMNRDIVKALTIPRVVDSPGHTKVRDYISDFLRKLGWQVKLNIFTEKVPSLGFLTFKNIIARQNPKAKRFLMLGCHYDSKYFRYFKPVKATYSAVSCAILLNLAEALKDDLSKYDISLMFVFFDGKEAFGHETKEAKLYGSRHLAKLWLRNKKIKRIELFLLLDGIGAAHSFIHMLIGDTWRYSQRLVDLEKRIIETEILQRKNHIFYLVNDQDVRADHYPFLEQDVPVIHFIAQNNPKVWHNIGALEDPIDYEIVEQVDLVLRIFLVEYLRTKSIQKSHP
ncbi:hypothetical protein KR054_005992, partial [Drosophila jambulina]